MSPQNRMVLVSVLAGLVVNIGLDILTDLHMVVRWIIALAVVLILTTLMSRRNTRRENGGGPGDAR